MERGVEAPRGGYVPFPFNFPMGGPDDAQRHREVALTALGLLEREGPGEWDLPFEWR